MSRSTELSAALEQCLERISPANGFATDVRSVYGFGEVKKDAAPSPYLLVRIADDSAAERKGSKVLRIAVYEVQAVFGRSATLQDLQSCHHDILRSLGYGDLPPGRELIQGEIIEESAEFDPGAGGSTSRSLISRLSIKYVETY